MSDYALSAQQIDVINALSTGATMTDAAEQAGIHRNTITNWRRNLLPFQYALAHAQYDRALFVREKIEELVDQAIQTIQAILVDPKASASARLKAALAILQTASTPPEPKKQIQLEIQKVTVQPTPEMHKDAQSTPPPAPEPPCEEPQNAHNSAQSTQPIRRETPKVGRNETCPCGSGQKYKRCCLNHSAQPSAAAA